MKRALITGVAGQDGSYLAEILLREGVSVFGLVREGSDSSRIPSGVKCVNGDLADAASLAEAVRTAAPHEIYNLGGVTDLKTAYEYPEYTMAVNFEAARVLLSAGLESFPRLRFLQASSSEVFLPSESPLNEDSLRDWETKNPYARAKLLADRDVVVRARQEFGVFACSAFLFSHESPRRSERSVIRKIARSFAKMSLGMETSLALGNVDALRDWGFAEEYAEAMWRMLQRETPEDFVIASGKLHSVREAVNVAAECIGMKLEWRGEGMETEAYNEKGKKIVEVSREYFRPTETHTKIGSIEKAKHVLGWEPKTDLRALVELMVKADLEQLKTNLDS